MTVLRVDKLSKSFGGLKAVDSVSLELREREILGIIGPNGAGKTTLFSMITGSLRPTSGTVHLGDRRISDLPAHQVVRSGVVRTHQIVRPFANLTVMENVLVGALFGSTLRGLHSYQAAEEAIHFVGLQDRAQHLPGILTLAQRKKLELARALAAAPRVLLLDEVIAGVNPTEAAGMAQLIRAIRDKRGIALIVIEHILAALMSLSDRVVVLDYGKKIAEGIPAEVVRNPAVIEAYLGEPLKVEQTPTSEDQGPLQ